MASEAARRVNSRTDRSMRAMYVDGSAVRKTVVAPKRQEVVRPERKVSKAASRNRAKALQMNRVYVLFLALVSVATVLMCVRFLQMKSTVTAQTKAVGTLETQLTQLRSENDALYNNISTNVDLENIKNVAMTTLGMKYATEDQIVWYNTSGSSYLRQYQSVPSAK
ncbi:MAG: hypothetical protein PHS82_15090 [Lachnospiraceae bacterium]|nr:hypothetical protein [Lachnospiraceae bacterium]